LKSDFAAAEIARESAAAPSNRWSSENRQGKEKIMVRSEKNGVPSIRQSGFIPILITAAVILFLGGACGSDKNPVVQPVEQHKVLGAAAFLNPVPSYYPLWGLNVDSEQLENLQELAKFNRINTGFILLQKGEACNFDNIDDGTGRAEPNPLKRFKSQLMNFSQAGGDLGITIGGAAGVLQDPLEPESAGGCKAEDLTKLVSDIVDYLGGTEIVSRIDFDIEGEELHLGNYGTTKNWDKIGNTLQNLRTAYADLKLAVTIPQWNDFWWEHAYNGAPDFFRQYGDSIDAFNQMANEISIGTIWDQVETTFEKINIDGHTYIGPEKTAVVVVDTVYGVTEESMKKAVTDGLDQEYLGVLVFGIVDTIGNCSQEGIDRWRWSQDLASTACP
jgi:hypothetical protein